MPNNQNNFENVLQAIHSKYISLPDHEEKRNKAILKTVIDQILTEMKKDPLFSLYFNRVFYGGSYYDGLKVESPEEFDLDFLLKMPKQGEPFLNHSNEPGYLQLEFRAPDKLSDVFKKKMLDNKNYLSTKKVREWMKSVFAKALNKFFEDGVYRFNAMGYSLKGATSESGPAMTLLLKGEGINIDIDFVPCFEFTGDQWPAARYRKNPVPSKDTFFIVPKSPNNQNPAERYWRLSFQEQERQLIKDKGTLKPTLKLFKRLRDVQQHKAIASYYIKTIFLLEDDKNGASYWNDTLPRTFFKMLDKYIEYIENDRIPYFWNKKNNLLDISNETRENMFNRLRFIRKDLLNNYESFPNIICKYLGCPPIILADIQSQSSSQDLIVAEHDIEPIRSPRNLNLGNYGYYGTETDTTTSTSTNDILSGISKLAIGLGIGLAAFGAITYAASSYSNQNQDQDDEDSD